MKDQERTLEAIKMILADTIVTERLFQKLVEASNVFSNNTSNVFEPDNTFNGYYPCAMLLGLDVMLTTRQTH